MKIGEAVSRGFQNLFNFKGRARRSEYWWFAIVVSLVMGLIGGILQSITGDESNTCVSVCSLIALVLTLGVSARRLHDTGKSGWLLLLDLTGIGSIIIFIFMLLDSTPGENKYGPNPKGK